MPLVNKQPFHPDPIPDNLGPDDEVFYHELTNEIFTDHDSFVDRFLFCNSLIWTCSRTGKSGLTYKEALDSEQHIARRYRKKNKDKQPEEKKERRRRGKRKKDDLQEATEATEATETTETTEASEEQAKKKKKKYPYDPKKYSMPVPEGFDPSLLTPTGKIDGRKLKSKRNKEIAQELMAKIQSLAPAEEPSPKKRGRKAKKKEDEAKKKELEAKKKEDEAKKKAQMQAELAKERELEAKRKKEAAALAKQMEKQRKEEEKKKAAAFLQNWDKKCEDLDRDDLRRLPQPVAINCDIPEKLFGDAIFILESLFNFHELHDMRDIFPEGINYDILEEILIDKYEDGALGTLIQYLLRFIFDYQPTSEGYGLDDTGVTKEDAVAGDSLKQDIPQGKQISHSKHENENGLHENGLDHDDDDDSEDKEVKMNDLIGSAISAAQEIKMSLSKPLPEMEIDSTNVTEILRIHLLQSGSFPKGRTIYNGWYSSREDPGLWLCMQEPDLIKKLENITIYDLGMDERIKIIHTLILQLFTFIRTRAYIEKASDSLTELRKEYRREAADFAKWERENCVKRMWPPKKKSDQNPGQNEKSNGDQTDIKPDLTNQNSNPCSIDGDLDCDNNDRLYNNDEKNSANYHNIPKNCMKANGFKTNGTDGNALGDTDHVDEHENNIDHNEKNQQSNIGYGSDQTYEELERAYQQNLVDYEDFQREKSIRQEQLNTILLAIRKNLRETQAVYGVHPIGRDRAYRRYWIFQSLPGLFVEQDDEYVGKCLAEPTPLESRYEKLFNKKNPLMHPNEADLIRSKTYNSSCSIKTEQQNEQPNPNNEENIPQQNSPMKNSKEHNDNHNKIPEDHDEIKMNGGETAPSENESEPSIISDDMSICTGDETTCAVHGQKRPKLPRWWFYHTPESIDTLVECLNKRGFRESELHDLLYVESTLMKDWIAECPAFKLNRDILEQSGIRRSRRLKTKGSKRRGRYERE